MVARLMLFVAEAAPADVRDEQVRKAKVWFHATLGGVAFLLLVALAVYAVYRFR
jgi:heme A synthase